MTSNKETHKIENRIFLVGCPRSGTTFLQSLLARHPNIASFPESHFFTTLYPKHEPKRRLLKLASKKIKPRLIKFLSSSKHPDPERAIYPWTLFQSQYVYQFIRALDFIAIKQGKENWLEKTPDHIYYINKIEQSVKEAKFIHILRSGPDVVASLYEVTHEYPRHWGGQWSVDRCVDKWVSCIQESKLHTLKRNHITVRYEDLVAAPSDVLAMIFGWLDIGFTNNILSEDERSIHFMETHETWKADVNHGIGYTPRNKFETILSAEQQYYVSQRLASLNV